MHGMNWMLVLIFSGFALMGIGFSLRDNNWGIGLLWAGSLVMLSSIAYKLYLTFG